MGALPSALGIGGANSNEGAAGSKFVAQGVNFAEPSTVGQANEQYGNAQTGLAQQMAFLQALQAQNGIQNQANVYNQLAGIAAGNGPNPAQTMLANATGANVANQAALMAGQRGAGANVGLIARQAAQQGAGIQQNAAGQAAALQAQQQLAAINQMGGIAGQQVGQQAQATGAYNQFAQNEQQNILNSINQQNAVKEAMQANMNNANAGIAQGVMHGQQQMLGNLMGAAGTGLGMLGGGGGGGAASAGGGGMSGATMIANKGGMVPHGYAKGGEVQDFEQTTVAPNQPMPGDVPAIPSHEPQSFVGRHLNGLKTDIDRLYDKINMDMNPNIQGPRQPDLVPQRNMAEHVKDALGMVTSGTLGGSPVRSAAYLPEMGAKEVEAAMQGTKELKGAKSMKDMYPFNQTAETIEAGIAKKPSKMAEGGKVPALVSPGEVYIPPKQVKEVEKGKKTPIEAGEKIPGKAKVKGDSLKNDTVHKNLEEGGIVLPRSIMQSKHPHKEAAKFVSALMAKNKGLKR